MVEGATEVSERATEDGPGSALGAEPTLFAIVCPEPPTLSGRVVGLSLTRPTAERACPDGYLVVDVPTGVAVADVIPLPRLAPATSTREDSR